MTYTKHQIIRMRDLNEQFYEILFTNNSLKFIPGSSVTLYNGDRKPLFIASGIQEPWARLILERGKSPNLLPGETSLKLNLEVVNKIPSLISEDSPNFILTPSMVSPFFSYASSFPSTRCKVCYLGENKISEDWVMANHDIVGVDEIKGYSSLYVLGDSEALYEHSGGAKVIYLV